MMRPTLLMLVLLTAPAAVVAQGPGGPTGGGEQKLVARFDADSNGRLNAGERQSALAFLAAQPQGGGRGRNPFAGGAPSGPPAPGQKLTPKDVTQYPKVPFYADTIIRTIFMDFEDADWEKQLELFKNTDVEVPATLTIDGTRYPDVGMHFRGATSFMTVQAGQKRSFNVTMDYAKKGQAVQGYSTLNLLNAHTDASFLRSLLFYKISRDYIPSPLANFVRVVINGESWGLYVSVQQFNKEYLNDHFGTTEGARWKVPGSPGGRGGLEYFGDSIALYRQRFEIKSKDDTASWRALIQLTKVLDQTPPEQLEAALNPILDVNGALRFLALDVALVNNDGYWTRASDYNIYLDPKGRFHIMAHDANETFGNGTAPNIFGNRGGGGAGGPPGGAGAPPAGAPPAGAPPGGGRGGGGASTGGPDLDPLINSTNPRMALRTKLLAVPALRARYIAYVKEIATTSLDPSVIDRTVSQFERLISEDLRTDTRKLMTDAQFTAGIKDFKMLAEKRRSFLLAWQPPS